MPIPFTPMTTTNAQAGYLIQVRRLEDLNTWIDTDHAADKPGSDDFTTRSHSRALRYLKRVRDVYPDRKYRLVFVY
jgi:hypothetical protein